MGQSTTGTALTTTAAATVRKPICRLLVDWADAGFGSETSWTNETAYVVSVSGELQALDWKKGITHVGKGASDSVSVTLRNPYTAGEGLRFSPSNTTGPLYAYIGDGAIYMKRAILEMGFYSGATAERLRQVTGYIVKADEDFAQRTTTFEIRDRAADAALTRTSTALYTDVRAGEYMATLAGLLERDAVAAADQVFDQGILPIAYAYLDEETIWEEMGLVAESQMGRVWFDKDGDLHFDDGAHFVKPVFAKASAGTHDDPTVSQATIDTSSARSLDVSYDFRNIWNDITVNYSPRYTGQRQIVYSSAEQLTLRPVVLSTRRPLLFQADFRYPCSSVTTPVASTDYTAVTAGGTDITADVSAFLTTYAGHADVRIMSTNTSYAAYVTDLNIRGIPLLAEDDSEYRAEDSDSIASYGRRTWTIRGNPYIQSFRHAEMIGDYLLSRFAQPVQILHLRGVPARPWLEPGDRVTAVEAEAGLNGDYFIGTIRWSWSPGATYVMDLELMRVADLFPYSNYFIVGTSRYGWNARLFW